MKKLKVLGVVLAMVTMFLTMAYLPYKHNDEVELEVRNRLVQINIVYNSDVYGCSGTLLSHNYVLTNAHCFPKPKPDIFIRRVNDQDFLKAVIVSLAPHVDYALLKFNGIDTSRQLDFTKDWNLGEDIIIYGNPGDEAFVLGHSRISGYMYVITPLRRLRTMFIYPCNEGAPGFSGSGIYNLNGEYLGTHELGQEIPLLYQIGNKLAGIPSTRLCYAIPAKEAMERNLDRPWYGFNMEDK